MSWTDERVALLKKLWSEGKTAAEIAKVFGTGFTRNSIIGKAHRLKLSSRVVLNAGPVSAPKVKTPANHQKVAVVRPVRQPPPPPAKINVKGIKLVDLKERMCRWPLGDPKDPNFNFCGCNAVSGLPYCVDHARMAYQAGKRGRLFNPDEAQADDSDEDLIKSVLRG